MNRCGLYGPGGSITAGIAFGTPPLIKFGSRELRKQLLPDIFKGCKRICIAITEPDAGSDVANIQTTATKSEDGKHYVVTGQKKWITNAIWSHYATMAVRTGGKGPGGLSLLVVPLRDTDGVEMRRIKVSGNGCAGTTFIDLDEVKVPVENLLGDEGMGMKYISESTSIYRSFCSIDNGLLVTNFNHERLFMSIGVCAQARVALSTAIGYALKREAFGHPLINQPVVRHRLAKAGAELESLWSWIESLVYSMTRLSKSVADVELGGLTALAKAKAGLVFNECAQTAVLLFGGNGYTRSGQGELVERMNRDVFGARIPGGSEDVMLDLAVRQLVKNFRRKSDELEGGQLAARGLAKI